MPHDRRAGQLILVAGEGWTQGCDDNGGSCGGCGSCEEDPGAPAQEITISLERRGDAVAELGIIEPDAGASFAEELRLPEDLEPGRYRLVARGTPGGYHQWSPIRVTR